MLRKQVSQFVTTALLIAVSTAAYGQEKERKAKEPKSDASSLPAAIWHDPGNISGLDLINGIGGKDHAPDLNATYTFVKEDMEGTSAKFDVKDSAGVEWKVKLGQEPQSETAATRLLWAAGYIVDEDYYIAELKVDGLPKLHRGAGYVVREGVVRGARLERKIKSIKKDGNWSWYHNGFIGTKEFNGLRVMMALVNNWDLKEINNSIYITATEQEYVVSDLGATFGKTGDSIGRSKSNFKDYDHSKLIAHETPAEVDLTMHSRPFFLTAVNVPNYEERSRMENITKHIPRADAKWIGGLLSQLSMDQLRDCFRAAGYSEEEVNGYADDVAKRIAELNGL